MLIQIALTLTVLLAFCGLALDVGIMQLKKLQLQNAADAAALGASYSLGDPNAAWAAAKADAALNGFTDGQNGVTVAQPVTPTTGIYANNSSALQVTIQQAVNPIFFPGTKTVSAQATALAAKASACLYMFSKYSPNASLSLLNGQISANCAFYLGRGFNLNSNSQSTGAQFYIASSSSNSPSNGGIVTPNPIFNYAASPDPLSYIPPPNVSGCDYTNYTRSSVPSLTLTPGVYCGGIHISNSTVTLQAGLPYIVTGPSSIGNSTITGNGVTIYMTQGGGSSYGSFDVSSSTFSVSAPTSGTYKGILFFADRNWQSGQQQLTFETVIFKNFDGIFYASGIGIYFSACSGLQGTHYFTMVADNVDSENGGFTISADYSTLGGSPFQGAGGGLVQ